MWTLIALWFEQKSSIRLFAQLAVLSWLLGALVVVSGLVLLAVGVKGPFAWMFEAPAVWIMFPILMLLLAANVLLGSLCCGACSRTLFYDPLATRYSEPLTGTRHPHAKKFLGSYGFAAVLQMARTGSVRCTWCDHELGAPVDAGVPAPE